MSNLVLKVLSKTANWSFIAIIVLLFNVFLLNLYSIYPCNWPCPDCPDDKYSRVMILSDPHLLGKRKGHPLDRFVREWEMMVSFSLAKSIKNPDVIIFLGDLLDEGLTVDDQGFEAYVNRFKAIFPMEDDVEKILIVGNHDIGFHDRVAAFPYLRKRWEEAFNSSLAKLTTIKGVQYISINSMAIEGQGHQLVEETEKYLSLVDKQLKKNNLPGRPVLLQHFPFYRLNDDICHEPDSKKGEERLHQFTAGIESLSEETSQRLLERYHPRLIFNGHIHSGCVVNHTQYDAQEWTVSSFNWRNRPDPNYLLMQISPDDHSIVKCILPTEFSMAISSLVCFITLIVSSSLLNRVVDKHSPRSLGKRKSTDRKKEKNKPVTRGDAKRRRLSKEKN